MLWCHECEEDICPKCGVCACEGLVDGPDFCEACKAYFGAIEANNLWHNTDAMPR